MQKPIEGRSLLDSSPTKPTSKTHSNIYYTLTKSLSAINMGIRSWLTQAARTIKLATKPGRDELWLSIKISLLGIGAVGLVGFLIRLIAAIINPGAQPTSTTG
jgi:protein translocase SEC61 complex gamma subunit